MVVLLLLTWLTAAVGLALGLTAHWRLDTLRTDLAIQRQSDLLAIAEAIEPHGPDLRELAKIIADIERFRPHA